ncbi:MAG: di-trans,poly-cis-decaprenylcistransferase [Ruminococcaceae bacterium]|nr:di-trans,poly-cis-decaprenylcistransferase [Oscillospiraceae bacterium]
MLFRKKKSKTIALYPENVGDTLRHIAFIMDGNGRWAKSRSLPREMGHKKGAAVFEKITLHCFSRGIHAVTVYAFSTENWSRPQNEVDAIMALLSEYLDYAEKKFKDYDARLVILGDKSRLSPELRAKAERIEEISRDRRHVLNIALNYGARDEIVFACNSLIAEGKTTVTKEDISSRLYTAASGDPDLVVRTGGDFRISNFLLWQSAYAEFYFTKTLWPDLTETEVDAAIADFFGRHRRFGGL